MTVGARRLILGTAATLAVTMFGVGVAGQTPAPQAAPAPRQPMSEEIFKNVQVLKGIPADEFMGTMGIFSAALGMSCEDCHAADDRDWANFGLDTSPRKNMARRMVTMMAAINKEHFAGLQVVTCYSCHRGSAKPKVTPSLERLYGPPALDEPDDMFVQAPGQPPAADVLDRYLQALGGTERIARLTSFVAKGTSLGYGPEGERPIEIFAKAPNQRTTIIHTDNGNHTTTFNGASGWISAPLRPVAVLTLTRQELDNAKLEAELPFPTGIKQALRFWRVGQPTFIGDRRVLAVQGNSAGGALTTFYFDAETYLLTRLVRYAGSAVGRLPTQTDYSDYRDVAGVKLPFKWTQTWLGGREEVTLSEIQPNVAIDATRFAQPGPPVNPVASHQPGRRPDVSVSELASR